MGIEFDSTNSFIKITSPTTVMSALEIYNAVMDWCDDQATMGYTIPMAASGKFDMGGGVYSDSIFMLLNGWKIKPYDGNYELVITGTLIAEPGESRWVPPDSGTVLIEFQVASQATVVVQGSGITQQDKEDIAEEVWIHTSGVDIDPNVKELQTQVGDVQYTTAERLTIIGSIMTVYKSGGETVHKRFQLLDENGNPTSDLSKVRERVLIWP